MDFKARQGPRPAWRPAPPAGAALCLLLWLAGLAAPAAPASPSSPAHQPAGREDTSGDSLRTLPRRWRLDNPLLLLAPPGPPGDADADADADLAPPDDEELDDARHNPARRSLRWLPSGLGTHWDLRGENSHPVRHANKAKHHRAKHHRLGASSTPAPLGGDVGASGTTDGAAPASSPPSPAPPPPAEERVVPLALSAAPSSRGAVADVVVDGPVAASAAEAMAVAVAREEAPLPTADSEPAVRVRPAVDVACYSSNQVLVIIAMTCMLSLGFIAVVMGCVHCCTSAKGKEAADDAPDSVFSPTDGCDLAACSHPCTCTRACPRACTRTCSRACPCGAAGRDGRDGREPQWSLLRRLVTAVSSQHRQLHRPEEAEHSEDSEEELLLPAAAAPLGPGSTTASMISLHSLHSLRERQSSVSMEDLLLLGRCR